MIPGWGYSESVLIDGDNLIGTPGGKEGTIVALNKKTGDNVWRSADLKDPAAIPRLVVADIGGVSQYVTLTKSGDGRRPGQRRQDALDDAGIQ